MFYAALSLAVHTADPASLDLVALVRELQGRYGCFPYVEGTWLHCNFGHLNGYSAQYYTYMWSLVIAKDLFSEFQRRGLDDPTTARRYRDHILAPGGSADASALILSFLARPYSFASFEHWLSTEDTLSGHK
jgi:thimet oligopeptidase